MELFERIRIDHREEGVSIRALADRHRVHRRTVRQALAAAVPLPRKVSTRAAPAIGPQASTIRTWLVEDLAAPRKQRHTARWVWQRLVDEQGALVAESTVRRHVRGIRAELESTTTLVTVPQDRRPAPPPDPPVRAVHAALDAVEWMGSVDAGLVAIEARRIAAGRGPTGAVVERPAVRRFDRPAPGLAGHDALLGEAAS